MINNISSTQRTIAAYSSATSAAGGTESESKSFAEIIAEKKQSGMKAKEYLSTLTPMELYIIQKEKRLAGSINIQKLSEEGAENLFVAFGDKRNYVDLNNDGITEIGQGKMFIFPPPNAPASVKDAWDKVTANMTDREKMLATSPFLLAQAEANMRLLPDGRVRVISPGEEGYINIFNGTAQDFSDLIDSLIAKLKEHGKGSSVDEQADFEFKLKVLEEFRRLICVPQDM